MNEYSHATQGGATPRPTDPRILICLGSRARVYVIAHDAESETRVQPLLTEIEPVLRRWQGRATGRVR